MNLSSCRYNRYRFCCLVLIPFVLGCSHLQEWNRSGRVGPEYQTPIAPVAPSWNQLNSPNVIAAANAVDQVHWWSVFGDPEIEQLVHHANANYLPLRAAILRVDEQLFRRKIAVGNLAPQQQEAFAEYQRRQFSENGNQIGINGLGNSFSLYDVGFNVNWEIDIWGRLKRLVESSDAQLQVSIEDEHDIRLCLTADVIATYIEIRVLQQRIQIARDQIRAQYETVRIATARFENGNSSKLDVTQAESNAETTNATIPPLVSQLRQANNKLCLLLGIPPRVLFDENKIGDIPFTPDNVVVGMPVDLIRRRPDIRRSEREVASQSALVGVAAAELFPTFSLRGTVNWQAFDLQDLFQSESNGGAIAPGVRWDILNYGRLKNNVRLQESKLGQAILNYQHTVLSANSEVESALTDFAKKKQQIVSLDRAVDSLRESIDLAVTQYRSGDIDLDRVNNLRKELISQLDVRTKVQGQASIALVKVYKTMGGGWHIPSGPAAIFCQESNNYPAVLPADQQVIQLRQTSRPVAGTAIAQAGNDRDNPGQMWHPATPLKATTRNRSVYPFSISLDNRPELGVAVDQYESRGISMPVNGVVSIGTESTAGYSLGAGNIFVSTE